MPVKKLLKVTGKNAPKGSSEFHKGIGIVTVPPARMESLIIHRTSNRVERSVFASVVVQN